MKNLFIVEFQMCSSSHCFSIISQTQTPKMKEEQPPKDIQKHDQQVRRGTVRLVESDGPPQHIYNPQVSILVIGDGDLSFSLSISQWIRFKYHQHPPKFIATTYDSEEQLIQMYHLNVKTNIDRLIKNEVEVYHSIDVCKLTEYQHILDPQGGKFDRIVWNFPHAGFPPQRKGPGFEWEEEYAKRHTIILHKFFEQSPQYLSEGGLILMAHKTVEPFSNWNIVGIAQEHGLELEEQFGFRLQHYPGYENRRGAGKNAGKRFPIEDAVQYVFTKSK